MKGAEHHAEHCYREYADFGQERIWGDGVGRQE